jgi:hypothetical protein
MLLKQTTLHQEVTLFVRLRSTKKEPSKLVSYFWSTWQEVRELRTVRAITKRGNRKGQKLIKVS